MTVNVDWLAVKFPLLSEILPLSEGGQKIVFSCKHKDYGDCVLKLIKPGSEVRNQREIIAEGRNIPNVPPIFEIGELESPVGEYSFILEKQIIGRLLSDILAERVLTKDEVLKLAYDLLVSIKDCESKHLVHRDIKPKNIIIDFDGNANLLDFGIVRILDLESLTPTDSLLGPHSAGYSAPEQFRNDKINIDSRADLFSIGITLYEATFGENPFIKDSGSKTEILLKVERNPLPFKKIDWDPNGLFIDFINCLTQKFPHQRPKNCIEALEWFVDVKNKLGGEI